MVELTVSGTSLNTFFTTHSFQVPKYQRDYNWKKEQIEQFWEDALEVYQNKIDEYFFGPMVLVKEVKSEERLKIVDGQQRTI